MDGLRDVLIIPYWVANTFKRHGVPLAEVCDFSKLAKHCSPMDVAQMFALNAGKSQDVLGLALDNTPTSMMKCVEDDKIFYDNVMSLQSSQMVVDQACDRLYAEEAIDGQYTKAFIVHDLGRDTIGVVIYPGYFIANTVTAGDVLEREQRQYQLLRGILTALYVQATYDVIARTSLYQRYLSLLSKKRII